MSRSSSLPVLAMLDKIKAAISRRSGLRSSETDACRLVNGAGDGLDGLIIDDFAGRWLISSKGEEALPKLTSEVGYRALYSKTLSKNEKLAPAHLGGELLTARFPVQEHGLSYWIDFQSGYSQGLFLDQRLNRQRLRELCPGKTVLNTFAYTCSFGVAAVFAGAKAVNLDLSRNYLEWGQENYRLNGLKPEGSDFIYGDVFDWLGRFAKRDRRFDLVILDPPTFSRSKTSGVFRADQDYGALLERALRVIEPGGILLCCLNAHHVSGTEFRYILKDSLPSSVDLRQMGMPEDFPGSDYLKSFWVHL
ncbi:MAG: class I SAM-dependent rRNA methyltransferase [Verrucomicrobia bacterium]|nr:class I SAM-dependent rRNA methyltransferase [Verrucomicrobiota bacterium]